MAITPKLFALKQNRRTFLKTSALSGVASALPLASLFAHHNDKNDAGEGFVVNAEAQETWYIAGRQAPVTIIVDKTKRGVQPVSLCFEDIPPGDMIPVHKHLKEVEVIFIQRGSGIFTLGDHEYPVKEGSGAFVPKGLWHGLKNNGTETIRMMFSFSPSGFEGYFREIGVQKREQWKGMTPEAFAAIDKKYGIVYKNPMP